MRRFLTIALAVAGGLLFGAVEQAKAENIIALTRPVASTQSIINFDSATPGMASVPRVITGLQATENLVGIDFRPTTGVLYGLSDQNRIYTINPTTGAASFVATVSGATLDGSAFGFDFNPVPDTAGLPSLRVVSNNEQNLRLNVNPGPGLGAAITDTSLAFADGDLFFGQNPNIVASAYANNFAGATSTTLYGIDSARNILVTQNPANDGILNTIGSLGVTINTNPDLMDLVAFDISGQTGIAYAAFIPMGSSFSSLYTINLATGAATLVGPIRLATGFQIIGLAAPVGAPVPEPATMILLGTGLAGVASAARRRRKALLKKD